jgi:hypothetical protein
MTDLLDDCWALVERAEGQFDDLQAEVIKTFKENLPELVMEDDPEAGEKIVYFAEEPYLPRSWGIDVGQMVNNARTALDHLIYALAVEAGGNPELDKTAFPIFQDRDEYWKTRGRGTRKTTVRDQYLAGVDEAAREKIDNIQPYHYGKNAYRDTLAGMAEIANAHKHKTLKPARVTIELPAHRCFAVSGKTSEVIVRFDPTRVDHVSVQTKVEPGKSLTNPGVVLQPKMDMEPWIQPGLVFGDPPRFYKLAEIKAVIARARSVIKWFEPSFDPGV